MPQPFRPAFISTAARRAFERLLARPVLLGLVLLGMSLLAGVQAAGLRTAVDLSGLVDPRGAAVEDLRSYQVRFGRIAGDEIYRLDTDTLADEERLRALEDLVLELHFVDGVAEVISLFSVPQPGGASSWMLGPELQSLPPLERLQALRAASPVAAQLLAADLGATLVVVLPEPGRGGEGLAGRLGAALVAANAATGGHFGIQPVGLAEVNRAIGRALIRDLRLLTPGAVILCMLLTALMFRSWRAVLVCTLPPVVGILWFFGVIAAWGVSIDPLMGALPVVLIVLCFSDSMHLYHAAIRAMQRGLAPRDAILRALAETAPAAVLTSLTTILAFASLTLQGAPSLTRMGQAGILGMLLCLLAWALLTPLLMQVLGAPGGSARVPGLLRAIVAPARNMARRVRLVPVLAMLGLMVLLYAQSQTRIGFRYGEYLPAAAPVTQALLDMEARGMGSDRLFLVIETQPLLATPPTGEGAPANAMAAARALWGAEFAEGANAPALLERLAAADGSAHVFPVQLPILAGGEAADAALRDLKARITDAGLAEVAWLAGPSHALLTEGPRLVERLRLGLYLTIGSITLLIGLAFGSARLALLALVPNLVPILGVEAWLVLSGRDLTIMNVIALTVAFGIAVDDTLHVLNRFRLARGATVGARIDEALGHAGPPMLATTLILMGGLMVTLLSALPGVALFGGLIALAVLLALLADLFVLPALMRWGMK
ncbi:MAG: efflux RND transporter permease subunit [Pararhodobacter sp.]